MHTPPLLLLAIFFYVQYQLLGLPGRTAALLSECLVWVISDTFVDTKLRGIEATSSPW